MSELRQLIREVGGGATQQELLQLLDEARVELKSVRQFGDLVLTAFFGGNGPKSRDAKRREYADLVTDDRVDGVHASLWDLEPPLVPFHWEIEFPEVFERENPGFDAIIGNPPFAGKNTIANSNVAGYLDWLKQIHVEAHGNSDLVAHFFRRAFSLVRKGGVVGLIATNTIGQGDTRSTGLRWICKNGGAIYSTRRRIMWPGEAAVVVSVVHIVRGTPVGPKRLDGREVDIISAFLFHGGGHDDPAKLATNSGKSFQGSIVLGMGFTFDDTDNKGVATPTSDMHRLIAKDPRNKEVIYPYIGGQEVNASVDHAHHRYVINFGSRDETVCRLQWPDLMSIVEDRVKPDRAKLTRNAIGRKRARYWWQYGSLAGDLYASISSLDRVLVISRVGNMAALAFLPTGAVFADSLVVFPFEAYSAFCALQSRPHEIWSRFFGSSMKDDLRYTPSDCFETFPFPEG